MYDIRMNENIREDAVPAALRMALSGNGFDEDDLAALSDDFIEAYYEYLDTHPADDDGES